MLCGRGTVLRMNGDATAFQPFVAIGFWFAPAAREGRFDEVKTLIEPIAADHAVVRKGPDAVMILCWWHLRKRCYEQMSSAGGPKDRRRAFEKELLGQLWEGKVDAAIELLRGTLEWVRNPRRSRS